MIGHDYEHELTHGSGSSVLTMQELDVKLAESINPSDTKAVKDAAMTIDLDTAACAGDLAAVELLIKAGADVNAKDIFGSYPLHGAAEFGQDEVCQALLSSGANVNAVNVEGQSPLHYAARGGSPNTISLLIDAGANLNAVNEYGATPLVMAIYRHASDEESLGERLLVCETLIDAGADPKLAGEDGITPVYCAVSSSCCDHDLLRLLVHRGADLNEVEKSPLEMAVQLYNRAQSEVKTSTQAWLKSNEASRDAAWDTVSLLVELGADLDHKFVESWDGERMQVSAADRLNDHEVRKLRALQEQKILDQSTMAASSLAKTIQQAAGAWSPDPKEADAQFERRLAEATLNGQGIEPARATARMRL